MQLFREISLGSSLLIVIGNIIGVGIFTTSGLIAGELGESRWVIGVWLVGGGLALVGALCYSVLARETPRAGGEYAFLYPAFGPLIAFYSGWASLLIGFSAPIAAGAIGLAAYAGPLLPFSTSGDFASKATPAFVVLLVTAGISFGLRFGVRLHSVLTVLNLGLLILFAAAILWQSGSSSHLAAVLESQTGPGTFSFATLGSTVIFVMFAYSGWNAAAYVAEEVRNPRLNIPVALVSGTVFVIAAYLLINLAYFSAVPVAELSGQIAVADIAARASFGPWGSGFVSLLIGTSIVSSITAMSIAGPRVYFAMARDGLLPEVLSRVDSRRKVPTYAIWFQAAVAVILILIARFQEILLAAGVVMVFFTTITVATLLKGPRKERRPLVFLVFWRILPLLFIGINVVILVSASITHTRECVAGLIAVLLGTPVYFHYRSRGRGG